MNKVITIWIYILLVLLAATTVRSQNPSIVVTIPPPYTADLSVWRSDPSRILVILHGGNTPTTVRISGYAVNQDNSVRLETKDERPTTRIDLGANEVRMLNGRDLSLIDPAAVRYIGANTTTIARTGRLPEGNYRLCLKLLDYNNPKIELSNESCASFTITSVDPPRLTTPLCDETIVNTSPQLINFSWILPTATFQSRLQIIDVPAGRTASDLFATGSASMVFDRTFSGVTSHLYSGSDPTLQPGHTYGWRVQAIDPAHSVTIRNNGYSDVCTFHFGGRNGCSSPIVRVAYPPSGERIPYRAVPIFVRFDPYCDSYSHFVSTSELDHIPRSSVDLSWYRGPRIDGSSSGLSREQAQYVAITPFNSRSNLDPGRDHQWNSNITITNAGRDTRQDMNGHFSVGMGPSDSGRMSIVTHVSAHGDAPAANEIALIWETARRPSDSALMPPSEIVRSPRPGHSEPFTLVVSERWMLEVSRSESFTNLVHFSYGLLRVDVDPATQSASDIARILYTTVEDRYRYSDSGVYYWRVKWLVHSDPVANDTSAYTWSETFHFEIHDTVHGRVCFSLTPVTPTIGGRITTADPQFIFRALPDINSSGVNDGRLQIWRMENTSEDHASVMTNDRLVFNETFTRGSALESPDEVYDSGVYRFPLAGGAGAPSRNFHAVLQTSYLWRVTLNFDGGHIRRDRYPCNGTSIVSSDGVFTYDTAHETASSSTCRDECSAPAITDTHPTPAVFYPGQILRIGKFEMHLTEAHGTGLALNGSGWIRVDFLLHIRIAVVFEGITVNANREVISGTVHGVRESGLLPDMSGDTGRFGLSQEQIRDISRAADQPLHRLTQLITHEPLQLPIGIDTMVGGARLTIGLIGMEFTPQSGHLDAAISIPMPMLGTGIAVGLGARNICFSPGGLGGDGRATLYLPADIGYRDSVDNNWGFVFKGPTMEAGTMRDSGTFVTWNCHGFEKLRIASDVIFPRTWLVPIDDRGNVVPHEKVRATFTAMIEQSYLSAHHSSWGWMATGTMNSRFAVPDAPEFIFDARTIAIDQSDNENPPGMTFPVGYRGETSAAWRGFYINTLMMSLPSRFRTFDAGQPIQFAMNNLMIDHSGFSASFRTNNVVSVNYGGWRGEIDTIGINFVSSSLTEGFLDGRILTPLSTTNWLHYRAAIVHRTAGVQFVFNVNVTEAIQSDLWAARLTLDPTTRIELRAGGGEGFVALLLMSGSLSIGGDLTPPSGGSGMPAMNLNRIRFENIALSTQSPYLGCANAQGVIQSSTGNCIEGPVFGLPGGNSGSGESSTEQQGAGGFAISLGEISLHTDLADLEHLKFGIGFNVTLHFQSGANGIGGGTTMTVWSRLEHPLTQPTFYLDNVSLNAINLDVEVGSTCRIAGRVDFYGDNDPIFGNGFRGHVRATFLSKVTVEATVQFGSKMRSPTDLDPFRYWYVDAMVYLPTGIPFMTGLAFYGFGGGAWYNMNYDRTVREPVPPIAPTGTSTAAEVPPGYTASGYRFIPSEPRGGTNAFGFRAKVAVGTYGSDQVFNADITMSVQFAGGGISSIRLDGNGFLLAGIQNRQNAIATVDVVTEYQFVEQTLHMTMSVALLPPYNQAITLLGAHDAILFHADPHTWYFRAGTPVSPTGLSVAHFLDVQTYLMAGNDVLPPGPLPEHIRSRLGNLPVVRTSEMRNGDGFAFGGMIDLQSPRIEIFPGWGQFRATVGFDFALLHQVPAATCAGSSTPIGSNGWYGTGRAYTYLHGAIGFVNYFYGDPNDARRYPRLLDVEVIAALAAGTPNPSWVAGYISGNWGLFGCQAGVRGCVEGVTYGQFRGQFRFGEECRPTPRERENPATGLELISQLTPTDGSHDVSARVRPEATFDYAIDQRFELPEVSDDGSRTTVHAYRLRIRNFTLELHGDRVHTPVTGSYTVASDHTYVTFTPRNGLHWESTYTAKISAYMEEWNGRDWAAVRRRNGSAVEDTVSSTFVTGTAPDPFVEENIAFTYPLNRQRYFLQGECRTGVVQFVAADQSQMSPAPTRAGNRITYIARFIRTMGGGPSLEAAATFNVSASRFEFDIPQLAHSTVYALQIIRRETRSSGVPEELVQTGNPVAAHSAPNLPGRTLSSATASRHGNLTSLMTTTFSGSSGAGNGSSGAMQGGNAFTINQRDVLNSHLRHTGDSVGRGEELLYYYYFRTSQFDRLQQKVDAFVALTPERLPPFLFTGEGMKVRYQTPELLDYYDMNGYSGSSGSQSVLPLIRPNANARTGSWHLTYTNPWIYDAFARLRRMGLSSATTEFQRYINIYNNNSMNQPSAVLATYDSPPQAVLSDADLYAVPGSTSPQTISINYNHGNVTMTDYSRLRSVVSGMIAGGRGRFTLAEWDWLQSIAARRYEQFHHTAYPLGFEYGYDGCPSFKTVNPKDRIIDKGFRY